MQLNDLLLAAEAFEALSRVWVSNSLTYLNTAELLLHAHEVRKRSDLCVRLSSHCRAMLLMIKEGFAGKQWSATA